jgi:hypothetical protein
VDEVHVAPSLKRHRRAPGRAAELYASDRGFFSEANVASCVNDGVNTVCIQQRGGSKRRNVGTKVGAVQQGQRFRAGIEGRISVLMRGRGMKRCRATGAERFALFVGAAVLANNLMIVVALLTGVTRAEKPPDKRPDRCRSGISRRTTTSALQLRRQTPTSRKRRDKNWQIQQPTAKPSSWHN